MTTLGIIMVALSIFLVGMICGGVVAWGHTKARAQTELLDTYKHLLDYGRTSKPVAGVSQRPSTVEEMASVRIGETARQNLTAHLAKEAGVSPERARVEADKLLASFETSGQVAS